MAKGTGKRAGDLLNQGQMTRTDTWNFKFMTRSVNNYTVIHSCNRYRINVAYVEKVNRLISFDKNLRERSRREKKFYSTKRK